MREQVLLQVVLGDEGLPAEAAAEGALPAVEAHVGLQVALGAEALAAEAAAERLLPRVGQHVGVQPPQLPKGLPTDATQEGFLPRVDAFVDLQDLGRGQALPAGVAGDSLGRFLSGVVADVRHQGAVIDERFPAELADVRPLARVEAFVAPQGAGPGVGFAAGAAGEGLDPGVTPHVGVDVLVGLPTDVADLPRLSVELQVVCQADRRREGVSTDSTDGRVGLHVVPQVAPPAEGLAADFAAVGRGGLGVLLRASLALAALWARAVLVPAASAAGLQRAPLQEPRPWGLADVDLPVAPERSGAGEALAADATAVGFESCVAPHVHFHVLEGSSTDPAGSAGVSVGLQVGQQSFR